MRGGEEGSRQDEIAVSKKKKQRRKKKRKMKIQKLRKTSIPIKGPSFVGKGPIISGKVDGATETNVSRDKRCFRAGEK